MFSDRPMVEEIEARPREGQDRDGSLQALAQARSRPCRGGRADRAQRTLPVTPFLAYTALGLCFLGDPVLIWLTSRPSRATRRQSILGIFGGNLLWTGGIEYGLLLASRTLGIGKTVSVVDGQLVAIYGEYVLLKYTWGILLLVMVYLLFLESSRCPVFLWWRKRVPTMRGPVVSGRIGNYGPRSAFQYATTVWGFYLLLLWAYDENVFGVYSWVTKGILFATLAGTVYCMYRLHQQTGWGPAIRYAIAAICVLWTPIEIFAKWGVMQEPWLLLEPRMAVIFFGGLGLGTWALWRAARRLRRAKKAEAAVCPFDPEVAGREAAMPPAA